MTQYQNDIAAIASNPRAPSPAQLAQAQQAMYRAHKLQAAWIAAPLAALTASHVQRGPNAHVRRLERAL
jgi:hypothetical protein